MKKDKTKYAVLYTPEGERLAKEPMAVPWNEYPRPSMRRESFLCLNGEWDFEVRDGIRLPEAYSEHILVPFVPQSVLSRIGRDIPSGACLCYRKVFSLPEDFCTGRVLLHFGAVDQIARVYLNGSSLGEHRGGYDGFSFDITDKLSERNTLEVLVTDELSCGILPYGKQCERRGGMWYTPISGIWQTVWLESVPETYIGELSIKCTDDTAYISVSPAEEGKVCLHTEQGDIDFPLRDGKAEIRPSEPVLWSPESPYLYSISVEMGEDSVESYFALRSLEVKEVGGAPRLCLNGEPYFFHGLLDQGYFSDGIFLPASPEGYREDILLAKRLGFNMLRKHIKVEPEIFYYECDRLGIAVFQDMVNNDDYSFIRDTAMPTVGFKHRNDTRMHPRAQSREAFLDAMDKTVLQLSRHPSVCYWTIFNEGWGQFDHRNAYERLRALDDTRFVDSVSGWFTPRQSEKLASDVESLHVYFKPFKMPKRSIRPIVLSEFGGYAYKVKDHSYNTEKTYGYKLFDTQEMFGEALTALYTEQIVPAVKEGLCATVYTQLSDVEDETNGLVTYDRRVVKVDKESMLSIRKALDEAIK